MKILSTIVDRFKVWYRGQYFEHKADPGSRLVFICPGHYKQPPLAKVLRAIGCLLAAHWQWFITVLLMALAIIVNILLNCREATG